MKFDKYLYSKTQTKMRCRVQPYCRFDAADGEEDFDDAMKKVKNDE